MNPSDEYEELFNTLDRLLRNKSDQKKLASDRFVSFSNVVINLAAVDATVRAWKDDIMVLADLRNAIVHSRGFDGNRVIAEPVPPVLAKLRTIVDQLANPKTVYSICGRDIQLFSSDSSLRDALQYMRQYDFSQIIVQNGAQVKLLSAVGIANWLEYQVDDKGFALIEDSRVSQVLEHEPSGSGRLVSRDRPVDEVRQWFFRLPSGDAGRLFAVIVTQTGRDGEKPLGIVTPWDLGGS